MLSEFICTGKACKKKGAAVEIYFSLYDSLQKAIKDGECKCKECGAVMVRILPRTHVGQAEVPGYEKKNKGIMTVGKRFDSQISKWV